MTIVTVTFYYVPWLISLFRALQEHPISKSKSKVREFIARHMYSLEDVIVGAGHFTAAIRLLPIRPTAESC